MGGCIGALPGAGKDSDDLIRVYQGMYGSVKECPSKLNLPITHVHAVFDKEGDRLVVAHEDKAYDFRFTKAAEHEIVMHNIKPSKNTVTLRNIGNSNPMTAFIANLQYIISEYYHLILFFGDSGKEIQEHQLPLSPTSFPYVFIDKPSMSKEEMDYLWSLFSHINFLYVLNLIPVKGCEGDALKFKHVFLGNCGYLTADHLVGMQCESLVLMNSTLTSGDLNHVLKSWLTMKTPKYLKLLEIIQPKDTTDLYDGLNAQPYDPSIRAKDYQFESSFKCHFGRGQFYDCSKALDIVRDDGKIGSVLWNKGYFLFVVWDEPFPEAAESYKRDSDPKYKKKEINVLYC